MSSSDEELVHSDGTVYLVLEGEYDRASDAYHDHLIGRGTPRVSLVQTAEESQAQTDWMIVHVLAQRAEREAQSQS